MIIYILSDSFTRIYTLRTPKNNRGGAYGKKFGADLPHTAYGNAVRAHKKLHIKNLSEVS